MRGNFSYYGSSVALRGAQKFSQIFGTGVVYRIRQKILVQRYVHKKIFWCKQILLKKIGVKNVFGVKIGFGVENFGARIFRRKKIDVKNFDLKNFDLKNFKTQGLL